MFEKIGQSAETVVRRVSVSRRGFLGRLGRGAAVMGASSVQGCWVSPELLYYMKNFM